MFTRSKYSMRWQKRPQPGLPACVTETRTSRWVTVTRAGPRLAPFDAIIVTCAPDKVPQPLTQQLKEDGRMIIPVGSGIDQQLYLLEKKHGQLAQTAILPVRFVPMMGEAIDEKVANESPSASPSPSSSSS